MLTKNRTLFYLVLILLLAALVRLVGSTHFTLWTDEGWTTWFVQDQNPLLTMGRLLRSRHPPLFFITLATWQNFAGTSHLAMRFPEIMMGIFCDGGRLSAGGGCLQSARGAVRGAPIQCARYCCLLHAGSASLRLADVHRRIDVHAVPALHQRAFQPSLADVQHQRDVAHADPLFRHIYHGDTVFVWHVPVAC